MMPPQLSHTFRRTGFAAISRNRHQAIARRCYAQARDEKKRGNLPWLVLSIGLTVPVAMYLWSTGPEETVHGARPHAEGFEAEGEAQSRRDPVRASIYGGQNSLKPKKTNQERNSTQQADVIKPAKSFTTESGAQTTKQQGLSNKETMHPYLYGSGKSEKAEGVTDTAKLLGTVSPDRGKKE